MGSWRSRTDYRRRAGARGCLQKVTAKHGGQRSSLRRAAASDSGICLPSINCRSSQAALISAWLERHVQNLTKISFRHHPVLYREAHSWIMDGQIVRKVAVTRESTRDMQQVKDLLD